MDDLFGLIDLLDWVSKLFSKEGRRELLGCFGILCLFFAAILILLYSFPPSF